jgi:membrane-associated protein
MHYLFALANFIIHIDTHLQTLTANYGVWIYVILFLIVFCETGLVVAPLLPGDSLLFAAGAIAGASPSSPLGASGLNLFVLIAVFLTAAIAGDAANFFLGKFAGERLLTRYPRIIKPEYLERTNRFYGRYGGKAILMCRFVPIIRTFAPFVAGASAMSYRRFMLWNITGALLWVLLFVPAGYFFGGISLIEKNFSLVLLVIIALSFLPAIIEIIRGRFE